MAVIAKNCKIYVNGYDRSGITNSVTGELRNNVVEATSINHDTRIYIPGIDGSDITIEGYYDASADEKYWDVIGDDATIITFFEGTSSGSIGYGVAGMIDRYAPGFRIAEIQGYEMTIKPQEKLVRIVTDGELNLTATQNGTGRNLGAVSSSQKLYSFLHVISAGGTSPQITVTVESDVDNSFTSPTTQITHTTMSTIGAEMKTASGPISDTWYRYVYTISGTSPSFTVIAGMGIK